MIGRGVAQKPPATCSCRPPRDKRASYLFQGKSARNRPLTETPSNLQCRDGTLQSALGFAGRPTAGPEEAWLEKNLLPFCRRGSTCCRLASGEVAEWLNAPHSKCGLGLYPNVGSNPTLSASFTVRHGPQPGGRAVSGSRGREDRRGFAGRGRDRSQRLGSHPARVCRTATSAPPPHPFCQHRHPQRAALRSMAFAPPGMSRRQRAAKAGQRRNGPVQGAALRQN